MINWIKRRKILKSHSTFETPISKQVDATACGRDIQQGHHNIASCTTSNPSCSKTARCLFSPSEFAKIDDNRVFLRRHELQFKLFSKLEDLQGPSHANPAVQNHKQVHATWLHVFSFLQNTLEELLLAWYFTGKTLQESLGGSGLCFIQRSP